MVIYIVCGSGFFFDALPSIVFAPVDICVIILSGALAGFILYEKRQQQPEKEHLNYKNLG